MSSIAAERLALEAQRRDREPERLDEALEAMRVEDRSDRHSAPRAGPSAFSGVSSTILFSLSGHMTSPVAPLAADSLASASVSTRALVVPDVERIERVDAADFNALFLGLGAHAPRRLDVRDAVGADIDAQFDRGSAEADGGVDQLLRRQGRMIM